MIARFPQELLCANDEPPLPTGTPVSRRLSDQLAPTRQHQPAHVPFYQIAVNRSTTHEDPQRSVQPKLLPADFRSPLAAIAQSN
jgi:hypothetical protein